MRPWVHAARLVAGWSLIALGLVGLLIPLLPQLPFLAAGALMLAPYVRIFRRFSAWIHKRFPGMRGPLRGFRAFKRPPQASGGVSPCQRAVPSRTLPGNKSTEGQTVA